MQRSRELRLSLGDAGDPADELDADVGQRVEVERPALGRAGQLKRRHPPRPVDVIDLVVALVVHAGDVHPPFDVLAPVDARRPHMLANGQGHRTARAVNLIGKLGAGRGRADHQHAAVVELTGIAVVHRRNGRNAGGNRRGDRRNARDIAGARCEHDGSAAPDAPVGGHDEAASVADTDVTVVLGITGAEITLA